MTLCRREAPVGIQQSITIIREGSQGTHTLDAAGMRAATTSFIPFPFRELRNRSTVLGDFSVLFLARYVLVSPKQMKPLSCHKPTSKANKTNETLQHRTAVLGSHKPLLDYHNDQDHTA